MLSLGCNISPAFGGASLQLATRLLPFVTPLLARSTAAFSSAAVPASEPRFDPDSRNQRAAPGAPLATHHNKDTQRFAAVLSHYRSHFPDSVWAKIVSLFPQAPQQQPVLIDIAVGAEGRAGVELAKRGFKVLGIAGDAMVKNRTFVYATAANAQIELVPAGAEKDLVQDNTADLVTCMHGLHLLDTRRALEECYRVLKPSGMLIAAFNDTDLRDSMIQQFEAAVERHVPGYSSASLHRSGWAASLPRDLFVLEEQSAHDNPVPLRNLAILSDLLNSQTTVRAALKGPALKALNAEVKSIAEQRFGEGPVVLPMVTQLFILRRADAE